MTDKPEDHKARIREALEQLDAVMHPSHPVLVGERGPEWLIPMPPPWVMSGTEIGPYLRRVLDGLKARDETEEQE
jgi:hypothetical protein